MAASGIELLDPKPGASPGRRSLHDEVTERLRMAIIEGDLAPGQRLNERILCQTFGISRTPLREAFKVLAGEGLVEIHPHRGAIVAPLTLDELEHTIETMAALERLAGALVVARMGEAATREVRALHYQMLACHARGDLPGYFKLNQAIHLALMESTGNPVLAASYAGLNARIRRYRYMANLSQARWDESIAEHEAILAALEARDGAALAEVLARHLHNKCAHVRERLRSGRLDGAALAPASPLPPDSVIATDLPR